MPADVRSALVERIRDWIIQDLPDELAACESECRNLSCRYGNWETCQRRLDFERSLKEYRARMNSGQSLAARAADAPGQDGAVIDLPLKPGPAGA